MAPLQYTEKVPNSEFSNMLPLSLEQSALTWEEELSCVSGQLPQL